jgi:hypothetical protein
MPRIEHGELSEDEKNLMTIFIYIGFFENYIRKLITRELKSYYRKQLC